MYIFSFFFLLDIVHACATYVIFVILLTPAPFSAKKLTQKIMTNQGFLYQRTSSTLILDILTKLTPATACGTGDKYQVLTVKSTKGDNNHLLAPVMTSPPPTSLKCPKFGDIWKWGCLIWNVTCVIIGMFNLGARTVRKLIWRFGDGKTRMNWELWIKWNNNPNENMKIQIEIHY